MTKSRSLRSPPDVAPKQVSANPPHKQAAGPPHAVRDGLPPRSTHESGVPGLGILSAESSLLWPPRTQREASCRGDCAACVSVGDRAGRAGSGAGSGGLVCESTPVSCVSPRQSKAVGLQRVARRAGDGKLFPRVYVQGQRALSSSRHTREPPGAETLAMKDGSSLWCQAAASLAPGKVRLNSPRWLCHWPAWGQLPLLAVSFVPTVLEVPVFLWLQRNQP